MNSDERDDAGFWKHLRQEAVVRKASRMMPTELGRTVRHEAAADVHAHMRRFSISVEMVSAATGINKTYLNQTLSGDENLALEKRDLILRKLNDWVEQDLYARLSARHKGFVETGVAEIVMGTVQLAHKFGRVALVMGGSGLGKSTAIEAAHAKYVGSVLLTMNASLRSLPKLIAAFAEAIRMGRRQRVPHSFGEITDRLRGTGKLILIDQAQDASDRGFKFFADLYDATGCPMVLVGTVDVNDRMSDDKDPEYGQLASRISFRTFILRELAKRGDGGRRALQWVSAEQLRQMYSSKFKLTAAATRMLLRIAHDDPGHLRTALFVAELADFIAQRDKRNSQQVTDVQHIEKALGYNKGVQYTGVYTEPNRDMCEAVTA